jgi:DNA-binding SARP family transcriptional activator
MDFRLLGPLEALDGPARLRVAAGKQRALLAFLLLHANRTVSREQIVDALWGEEVPDSAPKMVQIHVSQLRKAFPEPRLHTIPPGYLLEVREEELDLATAARPSEVLVSSTVKDIVAGSGIAFEDRGEHQLPGVPGTWRLFAAPP